MTRYWPQEQVRLMLNCVLRHNRTDWDSSDAAPRCKLAAVSLGPQPRNYQRSNRRKIGSPSCSLRRPFRMSVTRSSSNAYSVSVFEVFAA